MSDKPWDADLYPKKPEPKEPEDVETKLLSNIITNILKYKDKPDPKAELILKAMNEEGYELDSGTIHILFDLILKQQKDIEDLKQSVRFINGALNSM